MSSLEVGLIRKLVATTAVNNLISGRAYNLGDVPQNPSLPYIRVRRISTVRLNHSHQGASGLSRPRVEFRCVATTRAGARTLVDLVRTTLVPFRGITPLVSGAGGVRVDSVVTAGQRDDFEPDTVRFVEDLDLFVTYAED